MEGAKQKQEDKIQMGDNRAQTRTRTKEMDKYAQIRYTTNWMKGCWLQGLKRKEEY